jgi:3-oxoacyl-[acyl-carrier protein] reductase
MMKLCEGKAKVRGWTVEQVYDEYVQDMALKRVTTGQDVANAVLFMASDDARQITGQHIAVDGGWDV